MRGNLVLSIVVVVVVLVAPQAHAQTVTDQKLWTSATGAADLTDLLRLSLSEELRFGAESGYDQARTGLQLDIRATDMVRFAVGYTLMFRDGDPRLGTMDETRHRLAGDLNLHFRFDRFSLTDRLRLQFTTYETEAAHVHIRNRIRAGFQATKHIEPYGAVELIYILSPKSEYRETRFYAGVDWRARKRFDVGVFFLYQTETNVNMPEENFILGLELSYLFRKVKKQEAAESAGPDMATGHD